MTRQEEGPIGPFAGFFRPDVFVDRLWLCVPRRVFCKTFLLTDFGFVCPDECFVTPLLHWLELPRSRESGGVLSDVARLLTGLASPLSGVCVCVPVGGYIAVYLDIMNRLTRWWRLVQKWCQTYLRETLCLSVRETDRKRDRERQTNKDKRREMQRLVVLEI